MGRVAATRRIASLSAVELTASLAAGAGGLAWFIWVYAYENDDADPPLLAGCGLPSLPNSACHAAEIPSSGDPAATPGWPPFTEEHQDVMSRQSASDSEITGTGLVSADHHCDFWNGLMP